jgi:hypothetical protein
VSTGTTLPVTCKHDTYGVSFHPDIREYAIANGASDTAPRATNGTATAAHGRPADAVHFGLGEERHLVNRASKSGMAYDGTGSAVSSAVGIAPAARAGLGAERDAELPGTPVSEKAADVEGSASGGATDTDCARNPAQEDHVLRSTGVPLKACRGIVCTSVHRVCMRWHGRCVAIEFTWHFCAHKTEAQS